MTADPREALARLILGADWSPKARKREVDRTLRDQPEAPHVRDAFRFAEAIIAAGWSPPGATCTGAGWRREIEAEENEDVAEWLRWRHERARRRLGERGTGGGGDE